MSSETPAIALQGIEFWTTVAEREMELEDQAEDVMARGQTPQEVSSNYCAAAQEKLLPVLMRLLAQQEEDDDEDEWTVSKAAAVCLGLIAEVIKDAIVDVRSEPLIFPFYEHRKKRADGHPSAAT